MDSNVGILLFQYNNHCVEPDFLLNVQHDQESCAKPALILLNPSSIFSILFAKEIRMYPGWPNASPETVEICALFKRYIHSSLELLITSPLKLFPK